MNKPANLVVEETRKKLAETINESGLPPFLVEPILRELYNQASFLKQKELEKSKKEYENSLKKQKEKEAQHE